MKVRSLRRHGAALLLSAGLFALLWREIWTPSDPWELPPTAETVEPSPPAEAVLLGLPSRPDLAEIAARPPFAPSRRPKPPTAAATPAPPPSLPPPPPNLTLVGTLVGPQTTLAIVKAPGAAATQRLRTGQTIGGWEVVKIEKNSILLRAGTAEQEVKVLPPSQAGGAMGGTGMGVSPFRPGAAMPR